MKLSKLAQQLYDEIAKLAIIDAHEHLPPEKAYLEFQYSGLNFFAGYIQHDLVSAGLPEEFRSAMRDPGYRSASEWWPQIAPYWERVRHGSYARAALIAARDLYGIDDINDATIETLAGCVIADNSTGLYRRILAEKCNALAVITCVEDLDFEDDPYFKVVPPLDISGGTMDSFVELGESVGKKVDTLEDLTKVSVERLYRLKECPFTVGFKISSVIHEKPDRFAADALFKKIKAGEAVSDIRPLKDYLFDAMARSVENLELPLAVHAGVWGDFRTLDPKYTIYLAQMYPKVHFDLFHLGIPMVRDAVMIGKNSPNVSLNLCWSPVVSERMTAHALDEIIDMVPMNKIIAFGGDYRCVVQKSWGHLVMAREIVASVLAGRIEAGVMTEEEAIDIARMWFCDNPAEIYKISTGR